MKHWLNDLKPGDKFWSSTAYEVTQYEIIGNANNLNFRMPRFTCKCLMGSYKNLDIEFFVNQYVYDTYEESYNEVIKCLQESIQKKEKELHEVEASLTYLHDTLNFAIKNYEKYKYGQEGI